MTSRTRLVLFAVIAIAAALLLDQWGYQQLEKPGVYDRDFGRLLRVIGYFPLWVLLGAALWLQTRDRRRALLLALVPGLGGLAAEILKMLLRRERPGVADGDYVFRAFADRPFSTSGLAFPSSHALVAFSGAFILCKLYPKAWPVWVGLAIGCGYSRIQAHAHFLSDVTVAAVAAYVVVELSWKKWRPA
jgi:membrane-associated phospholipid phosphatase